MNNEIFLAVFTKNRTKLNAENDILAMIASDNFNKVNYYESNDVPLNDISDADLLSSLPFLGTPHNTLEYTSESSNMKYSKNSKKNLLIKFIKDYIRPIIASFMDENHQVQSPNEERFIGIYTTMSPEEFISFRYELLELYKDETCLLELLGTDIVKPNEEKSDIEVIKDILNIETQYIQTMIYFPYYSLLLTLQSICKKNDKDEILKHLFEKLDELNRRHDFIATNLLKFECMKICLSDL